ncbi:MAG: NfeD family protein [Alphaproteobacteria bacterium]
MNGIVSLLSAIAPQHWLALGFILLIAELLTGTTYLLWPAAAAALTAGFAAAFPGAPWEAQWAVFAALTIGLTFIAHPYVKAWRTRKKDEPLLNDRAAALVGVRAAAARDFVDGLGAVKINDSIWRAKSADAIEAGATVQVLSVEGATLNVVRTT